MGVRVGLANFLSVMGVRVGAVMGVRVGVANIWALEWACQIMGVRVGVANMRVRVGVANLLL